MIELNTPRGLPVLVPEIESEDPSPKFSLDDVSISNYYQQNGYVIIKKLFDVEKCLKIKNLWDEEVKSFDGYMYRQASAKVEKHVKNKNGWVMNPILNLQSINPKYFPKFRKFAINDILTDNALGNVFKSLFKDTPKIVQSMYFEGNSATWEHQDSYYLDSANIGEMAGAWIALEDITAKAGRFFLCPKSHKIRLDDHGISNNIAEHHEEYIVSVIKKIKECNLEIHAPILKRGDVLFWNSLTIHGSLDSFDPLNSRSSITCHAIPNSSRFLQFQTRSLDLKVVKVNNVYLYNPKDLSKITNKLIFFIECSFPKFFYWIKRKLIVNIINQKTS